ncbi:FliH/SctL family protein [Paenibacillus piri]|uniref:Flagellar assembly protein FliH n=1 Tax=Paenibacillus piri TaxID=2547395 RepID=A0A4R5KT42_9BACL|nr:FliH/SctL family protein [Paenibacillus piri]TDF98228.1 flagellar assembly protein FliH [Paenibacillus piri]
MSNVFKASQYVSLDDTIVVAAATRFNVDNSSEAAGGLSTAEMEMLNEAALLKDQMLQDAETFAEEQVRAAMDEAAAVRQQAQAEIEQWWNDQRLQDEQLQTELREEGFRQGYQEGLLQAETELRQKYDGMLQEASQILDQAFILKQQIIQESEPFLIELSCSIAEKVVERQLTVEPGWVIELIQNILARRREKGIITLCVAPAFFSNIQDAREELLLHIDSQAELQIIPDPSVHDYGCVVRSSFGSIDARIDTQLKEIKAALQHLALRNEVL